MAAILAALGFMVGYAAGAVYFLLHAPAWHTGDNLADGLEQFGYLLFGTPLCFLPGLAVVFVSVLKTAAKVAGLPWLSPLQGILAAGVYPLALQLSTARGTRTANGWWEIIVSAIFALSATALVWVGYSILFQLVHRLVRRT